MIVDHFAAGGVPTWQGTAPTNLAIETAAGKRRCASYQSKTHLERKAKRAESPSFVQDEPCCAKAHDDGHSPRSSLRPHSAGSIHRTGQRDVQNFENWHGVGKNSSLCYFHGCLYLLDKGWLPQVATRVEQISEWITMWRGFDF